MMKNKFNLIIVGLAAITLLVSCNKNNTNGVKEFRAGIEKSTGDSKTYLDDVYVKWTVGDQMKISNGTDAQIFEIYGGFDTQEGYFHTTGVDLPDLGDFWAAYPADQVVGINKDDNKATFNIPDTQIYREPITGNLFSFGQDAMPMVAYSTDYEFAMKNAFGGISFPVVGTGTVTKVVLTASADDHLCGHFTSDCAHGAPSAEYVSGGSNSVTLDCSATPVTLSDTETYFCFMLPPCTLASGFSVAVYNGETLLGSKNTTTEVTIPRNKIKRVTSNITIN